MYTRTCCYIYFIYIYSVAQRWCSLCNIRILVWLWGSFTLAGGQRVDCTDGPAFGSFLTRSFFLSLSSSSVFLWPSPSHFPALFLPVLLSCSSTVFSLPLYVALLVILSLSLFFQSLSLYLSLSLSLSLSPSLSRSSFHSLYFCRFFSLANSLLLGCLSPPFFTLSSRFHQRCGKGVERAKVSMATPHARE